MQEAGDYTSALAIFETISDNKDSADKILLCKTMIEVIDDYTAAKTNVESKNTELDVAISNAENIVLADETALDETLIPALETEISETKSAKYIIPEMLSTEDEIVKQTEELNMINYDVVLNNLTDKQAELEKSIRQYSLVNAPTESYIIVCLKLPCIFRWRNICFRFSQGNRNCPCKDI